MKKDKLKEIPTAELSSKEKSMTTGIYFLAGALFFIFATNLYSLKNNKFDTMDMISIPLLLLCSFVYFNTLKNMRQELSNRDIGSFEK